MDEFLDGMYAYVHPYLKRLKLNQYAMLPCTKEYTAKEIQLYVRAYALHKRKWFETKYDAPVNGVMAKRVEMPSWRKPVEIDEEEEL